MREAWLAQAEVVRKITEGKEEACRLYAARDAAEKMARHEAGMQLGLNIHNALNPQSVQLQAPTPAAGANVSAGANTTNRGHGMEDSGTGLVAAAANTAGKHTGA